MQTQLTHSDQYKMLRDEIMQNIRVMDSIQYVAAGGTAAMFTWLILNRGDIPSSLLWFVPSIFLAFCALKYIDLNKGIWQIGAYLSLIEEAAFAGDPIPGWERYKKTHKLSLYDKILFVVNATAWLVFAVGSLVLSFNFYLSRW